MISGNILTIENFPTSGGGVCPLCSKSISTNLRRHFEDIHLRGEYPCVHCGKVFASKNKLYSHVYQTCKMKRGSTLGNFVKDRKL